MAIRKIAGIFENPDAAEHAKEKLLEAGVALHRIVVSTSANTARSSAIPATAKPVAVGGCACTTARTSGRWR